MFTAYSGHTRFATTLTIKGAAIAVIGATALVWSDATLVNAMMLASFIMLACGLYEITLGARSRQLSRGWPIPVAEGLATLGLATLGITLTALPFRETLMLAALWLGAYGAMSGTLALALWPMSRTRIALLAWSAFNLLLSGMAVSSHASTFTLLYAGAAYAMAFGLFQLSAGLWVWRIAAPEVVPTRASRWHVAPSR